MVKNEGVCACTSVPAEARFERSCFSLDPAAFGSVCTHTRTHTHTLTQSVLAVIVTVLMLLMEI